MITLETKRLFIRDHIRSDFADYHRWVSDPDLMKFVIWKSSSIDESRELFDDCLSENEKADRKKYFFAIVEKESSKIVGDIGFTVLTEHTSNGVAEAGYFLLKEYWGRGFASEGLVRLFEFGFNELNLEKIIAGCARENVASEKVMIRCGMQKDDNFADFNDKNMAGPNRLKYQICRKKA